MAGWSAICGPGASPSLASLATSLSPDTLDTAQHNGPADIMDYESLKRITGALERVFLELEQSGLRDREVRHRYSEFLAASILAQRGHEVQLLNEREDKSADLYLPKIKKRVEVKSTLVDEDGWVCASFGKGTQVASQKFDYCVFVVPSHGQPMSM